MTQELLDQVIKNINFMLSGNQLEEALEILDKEISPISQKLNNSIIQISASYHSLNDDAINGMITDQVRQAQEAVIRQRMMGLMKMVPRELKAIKIKAQHSGLYTTTSEANLEKIQGKTNNIVPMSWIYKAKEVSKSVCQILRSDGKKGTGWLLENGWLMTNYHVIPNVEWAAKSRISLSFAQDPLGLKVETAEYTLSGDEGLFSPVSEFDYAYLKVIDNPDAPISAWGHLELDTFSEPQKDDHVSIIQHPLGGAKQIALTENTVIRSEGNKLFYLTDTERGSSGSPVFNNEWKVIALHHAGLTEEEGGLVVNSATGQTMGANEGILIKPIMEDINAKLEKVEG